jgi:O-antigen ligase/polysaccharide polymerase Wzy-like membrane protein
VSDFLQVAGAVAATAAAACVLLGADRRLRTAGMVAALALAGALIAGQAWGGALEGIRHEPAKLAAVLIAGGIGVALLAWAFDRWSSLLPLALIAMLPFRIPVDAGGETSNLLLPLYAVIAGGVALALWRQVRAPGAEDRQPVPAAVLWLTRALAAAIVLYAVQAAYSSDIARATQNIAFFYVPFAIAFAMLREADWSPRLLTVALSIVAVEAVVFGATGLVQEITRHIWWNDKAKLSNQFDLQFRVNSFFYDPNIYGRYLSLAIVLIASALAWVRDVRRFALGALAVAVAFAGLVFAYSQTSTLALFAGLIVLVALRWGLRAGAVTVAVVVVGCLGVLALAHQTSPPGGVGPKFDDSSGRSELTSGGIHLAEHRPLGGYGSGAFAVEFAKRHTVEPGQAVVSHTEPITIAAEQGLVGLAVYVGLVASALWLLLGRVWRIAPGLGHPEDLDATGIAQIAIVAAFAGLLLHTLGYAGFLTDPLTWALLAVAASLASRKDPAPGQVGAPAGPGREAEEPAAE